MIGQMLCNWVKASETGKLKVVGNQAVTPEQMTRYSLCAEDVRQHEVLKKRRFFGKLRPSLAGDAQEVM